jgi:tripartite-type tricarboxylate transporter receptor subunit TctC
MRTALSLALVTVLSLVNPVSAQTPSAADMADDYPTRPIRMILPNAPGSSNDILGRILAAKLSEVIGQQVIVENRAGAGGLIGMEMAKTAAPDGYTIVSASPAGMSIAPNLHKRLPYDPLNDFQFVSVYAVLPNLLVVTPTLPVKTVQDLIDYSKANPGKVYMASAGPGSQSHLAGVMLQLMGNFSSAHVPYKGGSASVLAVMTGESQWTITPASSVVGHVRSGKLRAIAHSLPQRTALLGDIATVGETIPGFSYSGWNGVIVPMATPAPIVERLRAALIKTLKLPEVKEMLGKQGAEVLVTTPEEFRGLVQAEIESTAKVVKASGLTVD